jgi:hypothetical protein
LGDIEATYKIALSDYRYSPIKHLHLIAERCNVDIVEGKYLINELYKNTRDFIYPDALDFLQTVDRDHFEFNILSMGDVEFQRSKIESADVVKYFDHIYITPDQKWDYLHELVNLDESFVLIDDRGDTINKVGARFPNSLAIEINRISLPPDPMEPRVEYGNIMVSNFTQLNEIISKFEVRA